MAEIRLKAVRVYFHDTRSVTYHFIRSDDPEAIERICFFLREAPSAIVGYEGLTQQEIDEIRGEIKRSLDGRVADSSGDKDCGPAEEFLPAA